jgi:hypothetical protein
VYDVITDPSFLFFPSGVLLLVAAPRACFNPTLIFYSKIIIINKEGIRGVFIIDYKDVFQPVIIRQFSAAESVNGIF